MKKFIKSITLSTLALTCASTALVLSSCSCGGDKKEENKPTKLTASMMLEYFVGETITKDDFDVQLTYKDGTVKKVTDWECSIPLPYKFVDTTEQTFVIKHSGLETKVTKKAHEHIGKINITFKTDGNGYILDRQGNPYAEYTISIQGPVKWGRFDIPDVLPNDGYTFDKWLDKDGNPLYIDSTTLKTDTEVTATFKQTIPSEKGMKFVKQTLLSDTFFIVQWDKSQTLDKDLVIPSTHVNPVDGKTYPVKWMRGFDNCTQIETVTIPSSITQIQGGCFSFALAGERSKLKSVTFTGDSQLETIENNAFYGCGELTSIDIPKSVEEIQNNVFDMSTVENPKFKTITFHNDGKLKSIGKDAFKCCSLLTSVSLPNTINILGGFNQTGLVSITIPASVIEIIPYAFTSNTLETVAFGDNSQLNKIGDDAFKGTKIATINIPDSTTIIGARAFADCTNLATVNINDTSKLKILGSTGGKTFNNCKIQSFTIPASVTSIGNDMFGDEATSDLTSLIFKDLDHKWQLGFSETNTYKPTSDESANAQYYLQHPGYAWSKTN